MNDEKSLSDEATFAGAPKRRPAAELSLGDERTLGDRLGDQDTVIGDIEVVDLEARYKIEGTLGRGGMGEVILALDTRLDRKVAIKRILGEAARSKTAIMRFLTEAKAIAALNHPNIVQVYDYGRAKDGPFLIMEYVDGGSLLDRCREGALPLEDAVDLACQLCDGLAKAHDAGIVHRDIKPANVLLNRDGHPKLTDFGLAKADAADHGMTMTGAVMGTPDFMSPEQRRDASEVDARSDLWSLAATVYQMVTGRSPKIIRFNDIPAALQDVLGKALEDRKDSRYQTARELRDALKTSLRAAAVAMPDVLEGKCPACGVQNDSSRRFCRGCGESLESPCLSCAKPMPMWEEICGACGAKQAPLVDERHLTMAARQAEAEGLLGDFEFDRAMGIAKQLRDESHPKLRHFSGWGASFLAQIEKSQAEQTRHAVDAMTEAGKHAAKHDYLSASFALEMVPVPLRSGLLPGMRESAGAMLDRVTKTQREARRLETRIKERLAAKHLDELLPDVERLLMLWPDRDDLQKVRVQLLERQQKQAAARDQAIELANANIASHDYEQALAALSGVAPAMITPEVVTLREQAEDLARKVKGLATRIKEAVAAKQFDGLLGTVEQYLELKPSDAEIAKLRQSLAEREEKYAVDIAARLQQAEQLEQACRFDEAEKLLTAIPKPRRTQRVVACLGRASRLAPMRHAALAALTTAQSGGYEAAIESSQPYESAIAGLTDTEFSTLLAQVRSALADEESTRRALRRAGIAAAVLVLLTTVTLAGLWARSTYRGWVVNQAVAQGQWDNALAIEPDNVAALVGRARNKLQATPIDVDGAFADLDRAERQPGAAEKVKPLRAEAYAWRAVARAQADELDRAAQDLRAAKGGGASANVVARAAATIAKGWLGRGGTAVLKGDIQGVILAADAALAAGADGEAVLAIWQEYAKGQIEKLDAKGLEAACVEGKKAGLTGEEQATWWIQFGQTAASPPHENAADVIRAADAALAVGADGEAVLAIWQEYAKGQIEKLDAKGLEAACVEGKKAGLTGEEQATWWIQFGQTAASAPHENAADVILAADAALAAGAEAGTVDSLRARGMVLEARSVLKSDVDGAVERMLEASLLDRALAEAALRQPEFAAVKAGVLGEYRGRFDQAVAREDWEEAVAIAGTAEAIDPPSATWVSEAVGRVPPGAIAKIPPLRNSIGIELKLLPAGTFTMGQAGGDSDERPHQVTLTKPFYMGVYEVTNAQWKRVMGNVPSTWKDDDRPVEHVSWEDAMEFCKKLSELPEERKAGRVYRLPTEAEWEYACRAGSTTRYSFGDDESQLAEYGWFDGNSGRETHAFGKKKPNAWGLFDMHGNVWEWCSDWHGEYPKGAVTDPQGPPPGASDRVHRGGGWINTARLCRSADRYGDDPSLRYDDLGFRLALSPSGTIPPEAGE